MPEPNDYNQNPEIKVLEQKIKELEERLNQKLDAACIVPDYSKGANIEINKSYTAECGGVLLCSAYRSNQSIGHMDININGSIIQIWSNDYQVSIVPLQIQKGDTYSYTATALTTGQYTFVKFYPGRK